MSKSKLRRRSRRSTRKFIRNIPAPWKTIRIPGGGTIQLF